MEGCEQTIDPAKFELGCIAPAMVIILVLAFLKRRKYKWPQYFDGRPGLVTPADLLGGTHNRYAIAAAFGTIASQVFVILINPGALLDLHWPKWTKVFQYIILVLIIGIVHFPLLACLTSDRKMLGSLMGFLYSTIRFSVGIAIDFQCNELQIPGVSKIFDHIQFLLNLPVHLCMLFLVLKFAYLFFGEVRNKYFRRATDAGVQGRSDFVDCEPLAKRAEILRVKSLLNLLPHRPPELVGWFVRQQEKIYKPRPDFTFSTQVLSTLFVGVLVLYQFVIGVNSVVAICLKYFEKVLNMFPAMWINILKGSAYTAVNVAWIPVVVMLFFFVKNHRKNIIHMWQSSEDAFPGVSSSPVKFVGASLRYSGYQVAYIFWGYVLCAINLFITFLILSIVITREDLVLGGLKFLASILFTALSIWVIQLILSRVVFKDPDYSDHTITINNRGVYSIMSFFLFFFHILVGALSGLKLLILVMVYGILFLPRLDRSSLMQGSQQKDKGYMSYIGLVHVLVAHRHPVLLVFCHLLLKKKEINKAALPYVTFQNHSGRTSQKAFNRWFLTLTLVRNPSLLAFRRRHVTAKPLDVPKPTNWRNYQEKTMAY